jgi:hypothetical protein
MYAAKSMVCVDEEENQNRISYERCFLSINNLTIS